jgi:integrase/recombinase XerD
MSDSMPHEWDDDEQPEADNTFAEHEVIANAFGRSADPLAEFDATFKSLDVDPFELYIREHLQPAGRSEDTIANYRRTYRYWREHMDKHDRHPACPNEGHLRSFATWRVEEGNSHRYTIEMLKKLRRTFDYFQRSASFPHSTDYNPVYAVLGKLSLKSEKPQEPIPMSLSEASEEVRAINHVRDRAMIVLQFKCGLRVGELVNIKIEDMHISNHDVIDHYEDMGTAEGLDGRENAVYIPFDRDGNKSQRPRVVPLDDEARKALLEYLLIRPDLDTPWLFLTDNGKQWNTDNVNELVWLKHFHPEWSGNERYRGVTSHYGRHFFSTWFHESTSMTRSEVKYMRGDMQQSGDVPAEAINSYIHVYYEDVEPKYRQEVFKFGL